VPGFYILLFKSELPGKLNIKLSKPGTKPILETFKGLFRKHVRAEIPQMEYGFVDGYSAAGKLIEIEVTGTTSP